MEGGDGMVLTVRDIVVEDMVVEDTVTCGGMIGPFP